MSKNLESRIRRLEALKPRRAEFDHIGTDELRTYVVDEVRALVLEGSVDSLVADLRAVGSEVTSADVLGWLGPFSQPSGEILQ